jgi:uncharacterized protein (DUF2062 family)
MTWHSFWTILLKILGLSIFIDAFSLIPNLVFSLLTVGIGIGSALEENFILSISIIILSTAIYVTSIWLFLFKTDWLIDKLSLDKQFKEDKLEINIHRSTTIQISTIVLGALLVINTFPALFKQIFEFYQERKMFIKSENSRYLVFNIIKTALGFFLITKNRLVTNFIERAKRN